MDIEEIREFYHHDDTCTTPPNYRTVNTETSIAICDDCAGIFDATTGAGLARTSKRFD